MLAAAASFEIAMPLAPSLAGWLESEVANGGPLPKKPTITCAYDYV